MAADKELLEAIHEAIAKKLLLKIESGEATAAEMQVARGFLRDNYISAIPTPNNAVGELVSSLPFKTSEEDSDFIN